MDMIACQLHAMGYTGDDHAREARCSMHQDTQTAADEAQLCLRMHHVQLMTLAGHVYLRPNVPGCCRPWTTCAHLRQQRGGGDSWLPGRTWCLTCSPSCGCARCCAGAHDLAMLPVLCLKSGHTHVHAR